MSTLSLSRNLTAKRLSAWVLLLMAVATVLLQVGCSGSAGDALLNEKLGGETTAFSADRNAFSHSARNLTNEQRRTFEVGDSFFEQNWVTAPASTDARDGLGPTFNAQSCSSCHVLDGRAKPPEDQDDPERGLLFRLSMPDPVGGDNPVPISQYGGQLTARGLRAFEYLAFADADLDGPRCEYLVAISAAAAGEANAVVDEWKGTGTASGKEPYADVFTGTASSSLLPLAAVSDVISTSIFLMRSIVDMQLVTALGIDGEEMDLTAIGEGWSGNGIADLRDAVVGMSTVYLGALPDAPATEDPEDRLLGIGDLVAGASEEADIRVREAFDAAISSIDVLRAEGESLTWLIVNERDAVMDCYDALKDLQLTLNTEVVSLLGISVGFADTDGDSG